MVISLAIYELQTTKNHILNKTNSVSTRIDYLFPGCALEWPSLGQRWTLTAFFPVMAWGNAPPAKAPCHWISLKSPICELDPMSGLAESNLWAIGCQPWSKLIYISWYFSHVAKSRTFYELQAINNHKWKKASPTSAVCSNFFLLWAGMNDQKLLTPDLRTSVLRISNTHVMKMAWTGNCHNYTELTLFFLLKSQGFYNCFNWKQR